MTADAALLLHHNMTTDLGASPLSLLPGCTYSLQAPADDDGLGYEVGDVCRPPPPFPARHRSESSNPLAMNVVLLEHHAYLFMQRIVTCRREDSKRRPRSSREANESRMAVG